jgi:hypothetical protein
LVTTFDASLRAAWFVQELYDLLDVIVDQVHAAGFAPAQHAR